MVRSLTGVTALAVAVPVGLAAVVASPAAAATTVEFTTPSTDWTVPANVTSVHSVAIGAGGGASSPVEACAQGGDGAIVTSDIAVTPGQVLHVYVATGGSTGGAAGAGASGGGGGGGATVIMRGTDYLVIAGGGGGAGSLSSCVGGASGNGGIAGRLPDGAGENGDSGGQGGGRFHGLGVGGSPGSASASLGSAGSGGGILSNLGYGGNGGNGAASGATGGFSSGLNGDGGNGDTALADTAVPATPDGSGGGGGGGYGGGGGAYGPGGGGAGGSFGPSGTTFGTPTPGTSDPGVGANLFQVTNIGDGRDGKVTFSYTADLGVDPVPGAVSPSVKYPKKGSKKGRAAVKWSAVAGATGYQYRVAKSKAKLTTAGWSSARTSTTLTLKRTAKKRYLEVRAINSGGAGVAARRTIKAK